MLPEAVIQCVTTLKQAGYPAYLVGGCVRDILLGHEPQDFDVATSAPPAVVQQLFPRVIPTGLPFGTVTVMLSLPIEVTTFRSDGRYKDGRHPAEIKFATDIETDLARRDFTINAMAWDPLTGTLIDPWGGQADLKAGLIRAVGDPAERFSEDGLRLLRAVRFSSQLKFDIEPNTRSALSQEASRLACVAKERIGQELTMLLLGEAVLPALRLLVDLGLLKYIIPELLKGQGMEQSRLHREDVLGHNLRTCSLTPPLLPLRLAGLLHDVGKPGKFQDGPHGRMFPGHASRSAALVPPILARLRYSRKLIKQVTILVENHMFFWRPDHGLAPLRRLAAQVGWDNFPLEIELIKADRMSIWGDSKRANIRELEAAARQIMAEHPPLSPAELALKSEDLMKALGLEPGPLVGKIRQYLLEAVWEDPALNAPEQLLALARKQIDYHRQDSTQLVGKK
ncbi:MAG: HD domain-containing protein [Firmicutes bacterium]|nr:HD domain-containing protein [Bacillota bacterium]